MIYYFPNVTDSQRRHTEFTDYSKLLIKYLFTIVHCPRYHQNTDVLYWRVVLMANC